MKILLWKKVFRQSIIITLIVSLAFTPVAALETGSGVSHDQTAVEQTSEPQQQGQEEQQVTEEQTATEQNGEQPLMSEDDPGQTSGADIGAAETTEQETEAIEPTEILPEISASSSDRNQPEEPVQQYEESASSWRYQDGVLRQDGAASAPRLYASFTPWTWSSSKGGYLSSDGKVINGAIKKGVDVSSWQGDVDWAKVKNAGIDFAIIRCGYGDDLTYQDDKKWLRNVQQCEKYGIPYGVYIYSYAESDAQAKSEAAHVLRLLEEADASPDYPVYYDLEDETVRKCGKKAIVKRAKIFCDAIEAKGYRAGIYANLNWWSNYLNDSSLDKYEKWVAQYYSKCQYEGSYRIWQCASDGKVAGIDGNVDINFEFQRDDTAYYMGRWIKDKDGNTVFQKGDGTIAASQWIVYRGSKFYVDAKGRKATGFQTISGSRYYFKNGVMQKSKWLTISNQKYYAASNGKIITGYKKIGSYYYIFDSKGVMQKSKWLTVSKKKYYASSTGKLLTGYKKVGNYYYGFNSSGAMLTGTKVLSGKRYKFASSGIAYLCTVKMKKAVSYRTGPSTKYEKKGTYKKNKSAYIIRQKSGWGQLSNGYWIQMKYAKKTATYPQFVAYKVKTKTALNYRTGPSTKYKKKGTYKKGKILTIKDAKNGWGKLSNGYWVKLSYTKRV